MKQPYPTQFNRMRDIISQVMTITLEDTKTDDATIKLVHKLYDHLVEFDIAQCEPDYDMLDAQERFFGAHYDECTGD